jgi:SiaC family regulatory phosphoprotein
MKQLNIEAGRSYPSIHFDADKHHLKITGESYPEDTASFYEPVFNWLNQYFKQFKNQDLVLDVELLYFNSSSSKTLADIFDLLEKKADEQQSITVNWRYHQDNDMSLEYGEEFQEDYSVITFNLVEFGDS